MATWRCPHCGTPQAESSRCWVCSQSPMTCSTCRNFRSGVVVNLGFCALDRGREPLTGNEIRACWQAPVQAEPPAGLFAMVEALHASTGEVPAVAPASVRAPARPIARSVSVQRPMHWVPLVPPDGEHTLPRVPSAPPTVVPSRPDARSVGRLLEARPVAPTLRLGSRGDARAQREAEASALGAGLPPVRAPATPRSSAPEPSAHAEGVGLLDGGSVS